jgi:hypothetical protein
MPKRFTPVSVAALQQISDAIDLVLKDPTLPRTKRQIEKIAGLSHATVARAFVQDAQGVDPSSLKLNARFNSVSSATAGMSLERSERLALEARLEERNQEIRRLKMAEAIHLQSLYAYYLNSRQQDTEEGKVVPIGANRSRGLTR